MNPSLATYRAILKELRFMKLQKSLHDDVQGYITTQFKKYKVTDQKYCRAHQSALFSAETYLSLLGSSRQHRVLTEQYGGRRERTTAEAANLVGLSLPKLPKTL